MASLVLLVIMVSVLIVQPVNSTVPGSGKGFDCKPCICSGSTAYCNGRGLRYIPTLPADITIVQFSHNSLTKLNLKTFSNIENADLDKLDLSWNKIVQISADAFSKFTRLRYLSLSGNKRVTNQNLRESLRSVSKSLQILELESLRLGDITGTFTQLAGAEVKEIHLSYNKIRHLKLVAFKQLRKLETLDIRKNLIEDVKARNVTFLNLKSLSLLDNRLTEYPLMFCKKYVVAPNLEHIDLSDNRIAIINQKSLRCQQKLKTLLLDRNMITYWANNAFADLPSLYNLKMSGMRAVVKYISPQAFNSTSLKKLNIAQNNIEFSKWAFYPKIFQNSRYLTELIMDANSLKNCKVDGITDLLSPLKNVEHLSLKNIDLLSVRGIFSNLSSLTHLILDGNNLKNFDGLLNERPSLQFLSVQENEIQTLTKASFPANIVSNLTSLNIGNNPFICTCELLWFKTFIGNTGQIGDIDLVNWPRNYTCMSPASMYDKQLRSFNPTEYSCTKHFPLLFVAVPIGIFVIVVSLTSLIIYRNIWYIRYWRYKFTKRCKPKDSEFEPLLNHMIYDSYVIYTDEDRAFVHGYLLQLIEEKMKHRLFIWHRDGPVGVPKVDAIADAIYASRTVIAILSSSFLNDNWCKFQLDVCVNKHIEHGKDSVSLIVMDDVDYKSLNKTWCVLLTKLKTTRWCQDETSVKGKLFLEEIREH